MVKTYNPKEVTVAFGSHIVSGFADDSFVTIEANGDGITTKVGCDGEIARAISPDRTFTVKLSLLQTSDSSRYFQERHAMDQDTGEGVESLLIKDLKGGMVFSADYAWPVKTTSRTFGKDTNNREWQLQTGEGTLTE